MKLILRYFIILTLAIGPGFSFAQEVLEPQDQLKPDFHQGRRDLLRERLPDNSVAVFFANAVRNRANDVDYIYHQDPDFFYLTGYKEPHTVLLIFKEAQTKEDGTTYNEIVFVQPRNERAEMWTGRRLGDAGVKSKLGLQEVFNNTDFEEYRLDFSQFDKVLFTDFNNDVRDDDRVEGDLFDLIAEFKVKVNYPDASETLDLEPEQSNLDTKGLKGIMGSLRGIKTPEELVLLRKAVDISTIGQVEVMKAIKPGMSETEIQGIHEFIFKKYGSEFEGYPSIVGAGNNGCILHYIDNQVPEISSKDMILMDLGAEYHGYTADVTRTIPINGKFNTEQKAIYDLVYKAQSEAMKQSVAGEQWKVPTQTARNIVNEGLYELGIIDSVNQKHMYFPHGISHHIGLDVHDNGAYETFEAGMVITVEPGVYIPDGSNCDKKWWGIAVRIEDCVLIQATGEPELLSDLAPRKSDEIEELMKQSSVLDQLVLPNLNEEEN
jgi:Xaa-Pro aminopeptidase